MDKRFLSIKEVNRYIKNLLEGDSLLCNLWIKGEISNFKKHSSGHLYFTLKDDTAALKCVMFRSRANRIKFMPTNGMRIFAYGYVSLYERDGQYQFYVEDMFSDGIGALHLAFEQLKEKLNSEGLFDKNKKRPLPFLPSTIGIVTSPTGAALRDILSIIKRRFPQRKIIISPALVQGEGASKSICNALEKLYNLPEVEVIIIGRGGGSLEELWCFNEEAVVRKISSSPVPIISAVGHETDFTLSDFAADCRAATPSMAAELVVPVREELKINLLQLKARLLNSTRNFIGQEYQRLEYLSKSHIMKDPNRIIDNYRQHLDTLSTKLINKCKERFIFEKNRLNLLVGTLDALSPLKTMSRGFSICYKNGNIIKSIKQINLKENIHVYLQDGTVKCQVCNKEERKLWKKS